MSVKRYNILISAMTCDPYCGGESANGWNWSLKLAQKGHRVWCLTCKRNEEAIEKRRTEESFPDTLHFVYVDVPVWVNHLYRYQTGVYFHYMYWQHIAYLEAKALMKNVHIDLVHHVTLGSLQLGSEMYRLNKPFIFGPVGGGQYAPKIFKSYFKTFWTQEKLRLWVSNLFLKFNWNTRKSIQKANVLFASNKETCQLARSIGAKKIRLHNDTGLPQSYYPAELPVRNTDKKLKILWLGRLFARKGLLLVLEALSKVDPRVEFELTIIGDGPMKENLEEWFKAFNLEGKVKWLGQVPWSETRKAYKEHNLFMFCSLRDAFASQFMEAMAFGLPILTLNINGARDMIPEECSIKVDIHNLEVVKKKLTEGVEFFYDQPQERDKMGKNAFQYAKLFEWDHVVDNMCEEYEKILSQQK